MEGALTGDSVWASRWGCISAAAGAAGRLGLGFGWGGHNIMVNNSFIHRFNFNSAYRQPEWNQRMVPRCLASPGRTILEFCRVQPLQRVTCAQNFAVARRLCGIGAIARNCAQAQSRAAASQSGAERMGNRQVSRSGTHQSRSAFRRRSGGQAPARTQSDHGYSSLGPPAQQRRKCPRGAEQRPAGVVAAEAAAETAVVDIDRSEKYHAKNQFYHSRTAHSGSAWLLAAGLVAGATLLPAAP